MTYGRGGFAYRRSSRPAAAPSSPHGQRKAWLAALGAARLAALHPEEPGQALLVAMRGLDADSFPIDRGDVRRRAVAAFLEYVDLWRATGEATRTPFAAAFAASAAALEGLLREQGAEIATASRERLGFREDD